MKLLGARLDTSFSMVPAGGLASLLLPVLALAGLVAGVGDFGAPGLEKAITGFGMFAAGVMFARSLPVWREASERERALEAILRENSPASPWLRLAKQIGWPKAVALFVGLCAVLALIGQHFR